LFVTSVSTSQGKLAQGWVHDRAEDSDNKKACQQLSEMW